MAIQMNTTNKVEPSVHPSIMINRIGVYYADRFTKNPKTLIEKCCYFRICCRLPHQDLGNDAFASMKKNAEEWYSTMNNEERNELIRYYGGLPAEWR